MPIKLKFEPLEYQQKAVSAVVDLFAGQTPKQSNFTVQQRNGIKPSTALDGAPYPEFEIDMETGTGKTFVYINTIFQLNKDYGFTKFIVVVPSIADKNRDVLEELYFSDFLEDSSPVVEKLSYPKQNHGNMFLLYSSMVNAIVDFCLARRNITTTENKVETLEKIKMLENEIAQLRGRLNQAKEFHEKMEINVEIKKIEEMITQWEDNHE